MQHNGAPLSCISSARGVARSTDDGSIMASDLQATYTLILPSAQTFQNDFVPEYTTLAQLNFSILYILTNR